MLYGIIRCGLFTDVSLYKIIKICINEIFKSEETVSCLNKKEMFEMFSVLLLSVLSKQCFCSITNITVKLTNLPWMLSYYLNDFRPVSYKRYDEIDIFVLLDKLEDVHFFLQYIYKKDINMKFSINNEVNGLPSFPDVKIFWVSEKFGY